MKSAAPTLRADINITPLIDIVLVLLIVFIVMVPALQVAQKAAPGAEGTGAGSAVDLPRLRLLAPGRAGRREDVRTILTESNAP